MVGAIPITEWVLMTQEFFAHAKYFQLLERDLLEIGEYVDLVRANETTYSVRLVRLLLLAGSEIDTVAKAIYLPQQKKPTILDHQKEITRIDSHIHNRECYIFRSDLRHRPWEAWCKPKSKPDWWQAHNDVKHNRLKHFSKANVSNVAFAMFGLFQLLRVFAGRAKVDFRQYYHSSGYRLICDPELGRPVPQY